MKYEVNELVQVSVNGKIMNAIVLSYENVPTNYGVTQYYTLAVKMSPLSTIKMTLDESRLLAHPLYCSESSLKPILNEMKRISDILQSSSSMQGALKLVARVQKYQNVYDLTKKRFKTWEKYKPIEYREIMKNFTPDFSLESFDQVA